MKTIFEAERQQLLEATVSSEERAVSAKVRQPTPPVLPMLEYLRRVEQIAPLFPEQARTPVEGNHWRL